MRTNRPSSSAKCTLPPGLMFAADGEKPGVEPQLSAQVLGNQNLPLLGELGYGHRFFLR